MGLAFEMTLAALRLSKGAEPSKEIVAKKIIVLAREGLRDPNLLCEWALNDLRKQSHVRPPSVGDSRDRPSRKKLHPRRR